MTFRREVRERLGRIEELLKEENRHALSIVALEKRVVGLERQNRELFDRLMAGSFPEFATYKEPEPGEVLTSEPIPEDADEDSAGEVLEIDDEA